ncbi:MAG: DUF1080 domain-containing protein [Lentisphaerae bacterium]|nr:DUF1080 domain-containing protein [Lentisphaerota bacterium]
MPKAITCLLVCSLAALAQNKLNIEGNEVGENWFFSSPGKVTCVDGSMVIDGMQGPVRAISAEAEYADFELEAEFNVAKTNGVMAIGFMFASTDNERFISVHYDWRSAILFQDIEGEYLEIKRGPKPQAPDTWHTAKIARKGDQLTVWFNGKELFTAPVPTTVGRVGFYASQTVGKLKNMKVRGTVAKPEKPWKDTSKEKIAGANIVQNRAQIIWTKTICKQEGRYIGWPSVCTRKNGQILAVFSGDREEHVCPWGKVQMIRSNDHGESWTEPETIVNGINDDRDAGIMELENGDLVVTWFSSIAYAGATPSTGKVSAKPGTKPFHYQNHFLKLPTDLVKSQLGYFTMRSTDGGKTWEKPVRTEGSANHGGIQLKDGRLMMVGRSSTGADRFLPNDPERKNARRELVVEVSEDNGKSWKTVATISRPPNENVGQYHEPFLVEADDGRLVALFRFHDHDASGKRVPEIKRTHTLRQTESADGGKTWSVLAPTEMAGYPPHLLKLPDGKIVVVYGRRFGRYGEYACISDDHGKTWDVANEIKIAGHFNGDLGYPASTLLPDGSILTVYYQAERVGESPCLRATKWKVLK